MGGKGGSSVTGGTSSEAGDGNEPEAGEGGRSDSGSGGSSSGGKGGAGRGGSSGKGGSSSGTGGGSSGSAGESSSGSGGGSSKPVSCDAKPKPGLPKTAPAFKVGTWVDITPPGLPVGDRTAQGMAVDPCNPTTIYFCVVRDGGNVYKSTDSGGTWTRLQGDDDSDDLQVEALTFPIRINIDPKDSNHLYAGDGVEGSTNGFWRSFDGGRNWEMPQSFLDQDAKHGVYVRDVYDVAADPGDFNHILVSSHSDAYVLESKDGGDTWIYHDPPDNSGGHSIGFLHSPEHGLGNSNTWLLGTQGNGYFRTDNAGKSWERVSNVGIVHGGGNHYYAKDGTVYATAEEGVLRSTDNGKTWDGTGPGFGTSAIWGDGNLLYTNRGYMDSPEPFYVSAEDDGQNWEPQDGSQELPEGAFELGYDPVNGIMYAAGWAQHMWAMKVR
jgi:photosystem II stability/assembly factor-like uncharacterized protein